MMMRKKIKTPRLILRRWKVSDKYDLFEYAQLDTVGPPAGWSPHKSVEESARIIQNSLINSGTFCITMRSTGKVIGSIGLHYTPLCHNKRGRNSLELGYVLNPSFWGNSIVPEAAFAYIDYAFKELNVDELWCACFEFNQRSRRALEKCGFVYHFDKKVIIPQLGNKEVTERVHLLTKGRFLYLCGRIPDLAQAPSR